VRRDSEGRTHSHVFGAPAIAFEDFLGNPSDDGFVALGALELGFKLLLEAIHDLLVGVEPIEELWQAWGRPDI